MKSALIVVMAAIVGLTGFYIGKLDPAGAQSYLAKNGYTAVQITMVRLDSCGYGTPYRTGFSATNSKGFFITGTVCRALLGDPWIQLDW